MIKIKQLRKKILSVFLMATSIQLLMFESISASTSSKNTIFNSVRGNVSKKSQPIQAPVFQLPVEPKPVETAAVPTVSGIVKTPAKSPVVMPQENQEPENTATADAEQGTQNSVADVSSDAQPEGGAKLDDVVAALERVTKTEEHRPAVAKKPGIIAKAVTPQPEKETPEKAKEPGVLYQDRGLLEDQDTPTVALNFEDASLTNLLSYMEVVHDVKFISDDIVAAAAAKGTPAGGLAGHKISFRTNKNLTRKESWNLFLTFMHMAGLDVIPMPQQHFYRVVALAKANLEPIPAYIGVDSSILPDSDMMVRFVYFTRNIDPTKIQPLLKTMQSGSAKCDVYGELKALVFTDRANSIKSLMKIVTELDRAVLPEVVSVVKLKRTNVDDVIKLYATLKPSGAGSGGQQVQKVWAQSKKESSMDYFPSDVILQGDPRTNSLIILGSQKDVQRLEEFVTKYIDISVDRGAPPIFTYHLEYTNASDILKVLNTMIKYNASIKPAGQYGGVRDGVKYFQTMNIVADSFTNSLIINSTLEDFEALKPLIKELDVPQRQIGLEVLIVQVSDTDIKTLGAQVSGPNGLGTPVVGASTFGPTFGQSMSGQTSGVPSETPIVVTGGQTGQDDFSIKSSLAQLLGNPALNEVGSVLVTFGQPIWAIFKVLKTITSTHLVANPFVVVSSNSTATVTSGEQRRLVSGEVVSVGGTTTRGYTPVNATLTVNITPQINKDNMVNLNINVNQSTFTQAQSSSDPTTQGSPINSNVVQTAVSIANGQTLVLGGVMSEQTVTSTSAVPLLENIPIVGWFFKGKTRKISRNHFMIFVCPRVLDPLTDRSTIDQYSKYKLGEVQDHLDLIDQNDWFASAKDPVQKAFFGPNNTPSLQQLYTSDKFEKRKRLDGKIDEDRPKPKKRSQSQKKKYDAKKKKGTKYVPGFLADEAAEIKPTPPKKNTIAGSVQSVRGM